MPHLLRLLLFVSLALLVPVFPFLLLGDSFEQQQLEWIRGGLNEQELALAVTGLLAVDLLLPVPSTAVSTYAGGTLPFGIAILATFGGMLVGNLVGFAIARFGGRPVAQRLANKDDLDALERLSDRYGVIVLVVTRALPLLAEASILLMGVTRLSWKLLLLAVIPANFVIALVYVSVGAWFRDSPALPIAIVASAILPLIPVFLLRNRIQ